MPVSISTNDKPKPDKRRVMLTIQDLTSESGSYENSPEEQLTKKSQESYEFEAGLIHDVQKGDAQPVSVNKAQYSIMNRDGFESYSCDSCRFEHEDFSTMIDHHSTQAHLGTSLPEVYPEHMTEEVSGISYPVEALSVKDLCANTDEKAQTIRISSQSTILGKSFLLPSRNSDHHQNYEENSPEIITCGMVVTRFSKINGHVLRQMKEKPHSCTICKKSFSVDRNATVDIPPHSPCKCSSSENLRKKTIPSSEVLTGHKRTHTERSPHKYTFCEVSFGRSCSLTSPIQTHVAEKAYNCTACDETYRSSGCLETHTQTHINEKPFNCKICKKSFSRSHSLKKHTRTHSGEKPYRCTICDKPFSESGNLKTHTRKHTGETPYKCTICEKSFGTSTNLGLHMRTHTGERPYKCTTCKKSFSLAGNLKNHTRTHTGEKPYKCSICEKSFSHSCNLTTHEKTHCGKSH